MSNHTIIVEIDGVNPLAVINKFGGAENAKRFLADELKLVDPTELTSLKLPFEGALIEEHNAPRDEWELKNGVLYKNDRAVFLHLEEGQKQSPWMKGYALREALKGQETLNASDLDHLLAHPELIPESWKDKMIFFWGTIFRDPEGDFLFVRYLSWNGDRWHANYSWLGLDWDGDSYPAAVLARNK